MYQRLVSNLFCSPALSCHLSFPISTIDSSSPSSITPLPTGVMPPSPSFGCPHPAFFLSNIRQYIPETLDYFNYLVWRKLFISTLKGHQVYEHVDDSVTPPSTNDLGYT